MIYPQYPAFVVEDIVRLRRRLARAGIPPRCTDDNFIVGTWNIRDFGDLFDDWTENPDSPKRNLRGLAIIAEIVRHFDVVALQEVKRQTTALRVLQERFLGPDAHRRHRGGQGPPGAPGLPVRPPADLAVGAGRRDRAAAHRRWRSPGAVRPHALSGGLPGGRGALRAAQRTYPLWR